MKRTDPEVINAMEFIKSKSNGELPYRFSSFECGKMMAKFLVATEENLKFTKTNQLIEFKTKKNKGPDAPTVQDVIDAFMKINDKSLPVFGFIAEDSAGESLNIVLLNSLDVTLEDRVDINLIISE